MEREKQKCAEKEKEREEHAARAERRKLDQPKAADGEPPLFVKSKFVSNQTKYFGCSLTIILNMKP